MHAPPARPPPLSVLLAVAVAACAADDETLELPSTTTATETCTATAPAWGLGGSDMLPGTACLTCHQPDGHARAVFSVAGTVFASTTCPIGRQGVTVTVRDNLGQELQLVSNQVGNVYSDAELRLPLRASLSADGQVAEMPASVVSGDCGACHGPGSAIGLLALENAE